MIHTHDGTGYEVINDLEEVKTIMFDEFIESDTFVPLKFPDGGSVFVRKGHITSFYESSQEE